jgi:hypothetical protein
MKGNEMHYFSNLFCFFTKIWEHHVLLAFFKTNRKVSGSIPDGGIGIFH